MRDIVTEPLYKALSTLSARKVAFNKYVEALREAEAEHRKQRVQFLASSLKKVFGSRIKLYNSYETAQKLFGDSPQWQPAAHESERREAFDLTIQEMKEAKQVSALSALSIFFS